VTTGPPPGLRADRPNRHERHDSPRGAGRLTPASLPGGPFRINVVAVALIPGTTDLLGGGEAHAYANPGSNVVAVILQYGA
jgi:hypothetical protein